MIDKNDLDYTRNRVRYYNEMPTKDELLELIDQVQDDNENHFQQGYDQGYAESGGENVVELQDIINSIKRDLRNAIKHNTTAKAIKNSLQDIIIDIENKENGI